MKKKQTFFSKQNEEPIEIVYLEHDLSYRTVGNYPAFQFDGRYYFLEDFVRLHNNKWFAENEFPSYIHGMESTNYSEPLFIEVVDDSHVNVYYQVPC